MGRHVIHLDRQKRACAHMQGHETELNTMFRQLPQEFRIEMQRCGRCRYSAAFLGEYSLVILLVLFVSRTLCGNIRWQGHRTSCIQSGVKVLSRKIESQMRLPVLNLFQSG